MDIFLIHANAPFFEYEKYLSYASSERIAKIEQLKSDRDKTNALLSHLFARHKASEALNIPFEKVNFVSNEYGKPYIENSNYHFSISHSENTVAFAAHTAPIGIDIQKIEDTISPAIRFFTQNERTYIQSDPKRFFEIWTKKEAYVKMLGTGLSTPLASFDVFSEGIKPMLYSIATDGFVLSICAENITKINIQTEYV